MILKKSIFFLWVLFLPILSENLYAQDSIHLHFDPKYYESSDTYIGFMKLFTCPPSGSVNYNDSTYQLVFPDSFYAEDTAIAFNYFTGWKNSTIDNTTAFLFGNYSGHKPIMYADYNHNLNFNDDGLPILFNPDSTAVVYLQNSEFPGSFFPIKFFYPRLTTERKSEIEPVFNAIPPYVSTSKTLGIDDWLGDKRMNYKVARTWLNGKKTKVILYDYNCNGLFDDKGKDRIMIGNGETNEVSEESSSEFVIYSDSSQLLINGLVYDIRQIESSGKWITLKKSRHIYERPIAIGDDLSELEIKLISGKTSKIKHIHQPGKYLLLDFWGTWCIACSQQLPALKAVAEQQSKKIQILGLSYKDSPQAVKKHIATHPVSWMNGYATEELIKKLRIDAFPTYLLLDENNKLLEMNVELEELKTIE